MKRFLPVFFVVALGSFGLSSAFGQTIEACSGPGSVRYDDGTFEAAYYEWGFTFPEPPPFRTYVMAIDSPDPGSLLTKICIAWNHFLSGVGPADDFSFDINIWDSNGPGGGPGTLLARLRNVNDAPFPPRPSWRQYDVSSLGIRPAGRVFVGPVWAPTETGRVQIAADENGPTFQPGYGGRVETAASTPDRALGEIGAFPSYRTLGIRSLFEDTQSQQCVPNASTLCLVNGRFKVEIAWETNTDSGVGQARTIPGVDFSGLFWFFNSDNLEMLVKVLDACALNQKFWVFYAATTNVGFDMTVTDTTTGVEKIYRNNRGTAAPPVQDTEAFSCNP
jgi:hypothetical protein